MQINRRDRRDRRVTIRQGRNKEINFVVSAEGGRLLICASKKKTAFLSALRDLRGEPSFKSNLFLVGFSAEGSLFFNMRQQKGYVFSQRSQRSLR